MRGRMIHLDRRVYTQCASSTKVLDRPETLVARVQLNIYRGSDYSHRDISSRFSRPGSIRPEGRINGTRLFRSALFRVRVRVRQAVARYRDYDNLIWQGLISLDMASPLGDISPCASLLTIALLGDRYSIPSCFRLSSDFRGTRARSDGSTELKGGPRIISAARIDESSKGRRSRTLGLRTIPDDDPIETSSIDTLVTIGRYRI
jgi:hypothetical protein